MAATEEVCLPREVPKNDRGTTYRNDGECYVGGKSRNRSVSQMGSSKVVYCPDRTLTYSTSHTSERRPRLLGY